jgi:hypothetical protein
LEDEDAPLTKLERFEYWQLCRIAIDYRHGHLNKGQALDQFARWACVPRNVAWMLLDPMRKQPTPELRKAFPSWIKKEDEPKFKDASNATRKNMFAKKQDPRGKSSPKYQAD